MNELINPKSESKVQGQSQSSLKSYFPPTHPPPGKFQTSFPSSRQPDKDIWPKMWQIQKQKIRAVLPKLKWPNQN